MTDSTSSSSSFELVLGEPERAGGGARGRRAAALRTEVFLDGRLTVRSRDGLHPSERAILPLLPREKSGRALVVGSRFGVLGHALRLLNPELEVHLHYDDCWPADQARELARRHPDSRLALDVAPDPPAGPWQFVVLPLERQGVADLVRERVRRAAAEWLAPNGLFFSSSDSRDDRFVRDEIKKAFGALHMAPEEKRRGGGMGYVARRPAKVLAGPPRSETAFEVQEGGETLLFRSRLGVFCCDRLDPGTRALLALADVSGAERILDLGCGSGVVGVIAARRAPQARVVFIDSHARGIESARHNAEAHGVAGRSEFVLSADPPSALAGLAPFDCVLTNPPYYGNWRIAELFLETAARVLAPGGRLQLVTKGEEWFRPRLSEGWREVREEKRGGYTVFTAVKGGR